LVICGDHMRVRGGVSCQLSAKSVDITEALFIASILSLTKFEIDKMPAQSRPRSRSRSRSNSGSGSCEPKEPPSYPPCALTTNHRFHSRTYDAWQPGFQWKTLKDNAHESAKICRQGIGRFSDGDLRAIRKKVVDVDLFGPGICAAVLGIDLPIAFSEIEGEMRWVMQNIWAMEALPNTMELNMLRWAQYCKCAAKPKPDPKREDGWKQLVRVLATCKVICQRNSDRFRTGELCAIIKKNAILDMFDYGTYSRLLQKDLPPIFEEIRSDMKKAASSFVLIEDLVRKMERTAARWAASCKCVRPLRVDPPSDAESTAVKSAKAKKRNYRKRRVAK
jgi:hypothetical protein